MSTAKQVEIANWLNSVLITWGSVDYDWVVSAAEWKFGVSVVEVLHGYWIGYQNGWMSRKMLEGDMDLSLVPGDGEPVELVVPIG